MRRAQIDLSWRGSIRMGLGWGWFTGTAGENHPHAHHALQILLADSPQSVWTADAGWASFTGVMIGPHVLHQLAPTREAVTLIYVEPDSDPGQIASRAMQGSLRRLSAEELERMRRGLGSEAGPEPDRWLAALLTEAADSLAERTRDALISQAIASLPMPLPETFRADVLAAQTGLSLSRFQHRFRAHTGLALRPYLRWRRLLAAIERMMRGAAITEAALAAGFSDAAHFTRTMRRHFGIPPSALRQLEGL